MIPRRDRPICKESIRAIGNTSSMAPISFENLLRTRPDGFVLKNFIVARLMHRNIRSCNLVEALIHVEKNVIERTMVIITVETIKPVYTYMQTSRLIGPFQLISLTPSFVSFTFKWIYLLVTIHRNYKRQKEEDTNDNYIFFFHIDPLRDKEIASTG